MRHVDPPALPDRTTALRHDLAAWRRAHPQATLLEVEQQVDRQLAGLRTALVTEVVAAAEAAMERPVCPGCGAAMERAGTRPRRLTGPHNEALELTGARYRCPACGAGLSPLGDALALVPGALSPGLAQCAVRLGAELPFAVAAELLELVTGTRVSAATIRRLTEAAGAACIQLETAFVAQLDRGGPVPPVAVSADPLQVSVDGVMVPLVHGQWRELRLAAIGRVTATADDSVTTTDLTYAARLVDAAGFGRAALGEVVRRGVGSAPLVVAVSDGAPWIQEFVDLHCPHAVRILDFAHAAGYLAEAAQAAFGPGTPQTSAWFAMQRHTLRHERPDDVLAAVDALPPSEARDRARHYLGERRAMLAYAEFAARGYPIGSGCVESANQLVVEARLKGSGMHWTEGHADAMAALRTVLRNHRWAATWPHIVRELRARRPAAAARRRAAARPLVTPVPSAPPPSATRPAQNTAHVPTIVGGRPTVQHPWRRFPVFAHRPTPSTPPRPT